MKEILLDTCALLWLGFGDEKLSLSTRQIIEKANVVYVALISLWEISNKYAQGKIRLPIQPREWFDAVRERYNLTVLPYSKETMFLAGELPFHHKDPADRMIIASAIENNLPVVTADRNFPLYGIKIIFCNEN